MDAFADAPGRPRTPSTLLLPIIKRRQYVLIMENERPVFFLSWAWLNPESEARYLTRPAIEMPEADWNSGDRMWFCDWIAPFGHTAAMNALMRQDILPTTARGRCITAANNAASGW